MTARPQPAYAALTDIGRVRTHNEDTVLAMPPLFVVADGLGGHEAGEVASSIAVETLRDHAPAHPDSKALARAVKAANREVLRAAKEGVGRAGMGTTMTAAIVEGTTIAFAHVGDSRAYLFADGKLRRITEDHSMVADMIRRGQLTEAESRVHPNRSVITRALGTDANMEADAYEIEVPAGSRLLLCSDGLTSMLVDEKIEEVLAEGADPEGSARALIAEANTAGGQDNISVIIVDIDDGTRPPAAVARNFSVAKLAISVMAWLLVFVLLVVGVGFGVYRYAQSRYFLIAEDGIVVIYRGVPGQIAGQTLKWEAERTAVAVAGLSPGTQQRLAEGVPAASFAEAMRTAESYREQARPSLDVQPSTDTTSP